MKASRRSALTLAVLIGLLTAPATVGGCKRTAKVELPVAEAFDGERTYAWSGDVPALARIGDAARAEDVVARLRQELDEQLQGRGFRKVEGRAARFYAALYLGVEKDTRSSDPLFTAYPYERIERGHAVLTLTEPRNGDVAPAWSGTTDAVLRVTERGMGHDKIRWKATDSPQKWPVDSIASTLGNRLPGLN